MDAEPLLKPCATSWPCSTSKCYGLYDNYSYWGYSQSRSIGCIECISVCACTLHTYVTYATIKWGTSQSSHVLINIWWYSLRFSSSFSTNTEQTTTGSSAYYRYSAVAVDAAVCVCVVVCTVCIHTHTLQIRCIFYTNSIHTLCTPSSMQAASGLMVGERVRTQHVKIQQGLVYLNCLIRHEHIPYTPTTTTYT